MKQKKVSIIMGVYNEGERLRESIESIINQTYKNWEFIICDDCSIDNTFEILNEYSKRDDRIIVIKNKKNKGLAETLNKCIKIAQGEYIARQDGDDISKPDRLAKQVNFLENNKEYCMVGSNAFIINETGDIDGVIKYPEKPKKEDLIKNSPFIHPTLIIRRDVLLQVKGYNKLKVRVEDYDLWFRLYSKGYLGYNIQDELLYYRLDSNSYKKRKYKYRISEFKVRLYGYSINKIKYRHRIYALKPLIVGIIPGNIMYSIHLKKFKK